MGLMLGAALAFAWSAPHRAWTTAAWWPAQRRRVAGAALVTLGALFVLGSESSALTFRGGILLASLATTALVLVVVERPGRLRALLELPAARWVGARSYGIYLWHWPVFLVVGQDLPVAPGGTTYVLTRVWCVVVTLVVADLSFRLVEVPVRRHGFAGSAREAMRRLRGIGTRGARVVWGTVLVLTVALVAVRAHRSGPLLHPGAHRRQRGRPDRRRTRAVRHDVGGPGIREGRARPRRPRATADWSMPSGSEIDAFGDSMMVGASHALRYYLPEDPDGREVQPPLVAAPPTGSRPAATRCAGPWSSRSARTPAPTSRSSTAPSTPSAPTGWSSS